MEHLEREKFYFGPAQRSFLKVPSHLARESTGVLFDLTALKSIYDLGHYSSRNWFTSDCIFSEVRSDAFAVRRTRPQAANGEQFVFVHRYIEGALKGRIGDLNINRDMSAIYVLDQASRVECVQRQAVMQSAILPKSLIGYDPDKHAPLLSFPKSHGLGQMLNAIFDRLFDGLLAEDAIYPKDFRQLIACLRLGLGADPREGDIRRHAREAMQQVISEHIERHLGDEELGVQSVLKNFGVSRASLYRMFEDTGGVRQYINDRRLLRAILEISNGPNLRGHISAAAERWGFHSPSTFNRAVKREFGVAPGTLIDLPNANSADLNAKAVSRDFVRATGQHIGQVVGEEMRMPV